MHVIQEIAVAVTRGDQEIAPKGGSIQPPRAHMPTVFRRDALDLMWTKRRDELGHRGRQSEQEARGAPIRACSGPNQYQCFAHELCGGLRGKASHPYVSSPASAAMLPCPAPPVLALKMHIDEQEGALRRPSARRRIQIAPEAPMGSDKLKFPPRTVGIGERDQQLDAALIQCVDKRERRRTSPRGWRERRRGMAAVVGAQDQANTHALRIGADIVRYNSKDRRSRFGAYSVETHR